MADDWLEDDLEAVQPKKKRRLRVEHNGISRDDGPSSSFSSTPSSLALNGRHRHPNGSSVCRGPCCFPSSRSLRCIFFVLFLLFCLLSSGAAVSSTARRSLSQKKNGAVRPHQVRMTQMPGMVRLGRREVNRSHSPTLTDDDDTRAATPPPLLHTHTQVRQNP